MRIFPSFLLGLLWGSIMWLPWCGCQVEFQATLTLVELSQPVVGIDYFTVINSTSSNFFTGDFQNAADSGTTSESHGIVSTIGSSTSTTSSTALEPWPTTLITTSPFVSSATIATSWMITSIVTNPTNASGFEETTGAPPAATSTTSVWNGTNITNDSLTFIETTSNFQMYSTNASTASQTSADVGLMTSLAPSTSTALMVTTSISQRTTAKSAFRGTFSILSTRLVSTTSAISVNENVSIQLEAPDVCYFNNNTNNYCEILDPQNDSLCLVCMAGFLLNQSSQRCEKCTAGTYWYVEDMENPSMERKCLPCEAGKSTNGLQGQVQCLECAVNYSTVGNTAMAKCIECDSGVSFTKIRGSAYCECLDGFFWNNISNQCQKCAPGYVDHRKLLQRPFNEYTTLNILECSICPRGFYQNESGKTGCTGCEMGKYSNRVAASACEWCPVNTFNHMENQTTCVSCKENEYTPLQGSLFCFCGEGSYHESFFESRRDCNPFCACNLCSRGKYGLPKSSFLVGGAEVLWIYAFEKIDWSQLTNSSARCNECGLGQYNKDEGATRCVDCEYGKYGNSTGSSACMDCVRGFTVTTKNTQKSDCICYIGTYNKIPDLDCTFCPVGTYQPNTNQTSCVACEQGTFSVQIGLSENQCENCGLNLYNPSQGQSSCLSCGTFARTLSMGSTKAQHCVCEAGTGKLNNDSADCRICLVGTYQPHSIMENTTCIPCEMGKFASGLNSSACQLCPSGKYNDEVGKRACTDCFLNNEYAFSKWGKGSTNQSECRCAPGFFPNGSFCQYCPVGSFQSNVNGSDFCALCIPGKYSEYVARANDCDWCPNGFYSDKNGSSSCTPCYGGSSNTFRTTVERGADSQEFCVCVSGLVLQHESCEPCPRGTYDNGSACCDCNEGQFASGMGSTVCEWCALGKYNANTGQSSCKSCHAGVTPSLGITFSEGAVSYLSCYCHIGTFFNASSASGALEICQLCPRGSFQNAFNATFCIQCPPGTASDMEGNSFQCTECERGYYTTNPGEANCTKCEAYQTTLTKRSTTKDSCICAAGSFFSDSENMQQCTLCHPGKFQHEQNQSFCWDCELGSWSPEAGATGYCQDCMRGSVRVFQNKTFFLVQNNSATRALFTTREFCSLCRPGFYQPLEVTNDNDRSVSCIPCAVGTYAAQSGATVCLQCPNQTFGNQVGLQACSKCSSNSLTFQLGSSECICSRGSYLETQSQTCVLCSVGSYQDMYGKTTCIECSVGSYLDVMGGDESCRRCPVNTYNTFKGMSQCYDCPLHSSTRGMLGRDYCPCDAGYVPLEFNRRECGECRPGTYGLYATDVNRCELCGLGSFSNTSAATACVSCEVNSYTSTTGLTACTACPPTTRVSLNRQSCTCEVGSEYSVRNSEGQIQECLPCTTTCASQDQYIAEKCSLERNTVCRRCTVACPFNYYKRRNCSLHNDLDCTICGTLCSVGAYIKKACTLQSDIQCEYCTASCPKWHRIENACNAHNDLDCTACETGKFPDASNGFRSCISCPNETYIFVLQSPLARLHAFEYRCEKCSGGLVSANKTLCLASSVKCLPGEYRRTAKECDFCPANTFSQDGLGCQPCPILYNCDPPTAIGKTECTRCDTETFLREKANFVTKDTCAK